jgi:hypothetical protein
MASLITRIIPVFLALSLCLPCLPADLFIGQPPDLLRGEDPVPRACLNASRHVNPVAGALNAFKNTDTGTLSGNGSPATVTGDTGAVRPGSTAAGSHSRKPLRTSPCLWCAPLLPIPPPAAPRRGIS